MKRKCPQCAEKIQAKAKKCKHCGAEVEPVKQSSLPGCLGLIALVVIVGMCVGRSSEYEKEQRAERAVAKVHEGAEATFDEFREGRDYHVHEKWKPHAAAEAPKPSAYGVRASLTRRMDRDELTRLVKQLAKGHSPFVIDVYRTKQAWNKCRSGDSWKLPLCKKQHLLTANDMNGRGRILWLGPFDEAETTKF